MPSRRLDFLKSNESENQISELAIWWANTITPFKDGSSRSLIHSMSERHFYAKCSAKTGLRRAFLLKMTSALLDPIKVIYGWLTISANNRGCPCNCKLKLLFFFKTYWWNSIINENYPVLADTNLSFTIAWFLTEKAGIFAFLITRTERNYRFSDQTEIKTGYDAKGGGLRNVPKK